MIVRRRSPEADLDAELRDHLQRQIDDYIAGGLSPDDARRRAQLEFGALELAKDECRDVRPLQRLETFWRDARLGLRALGRERLFAFSVTLILAAGIGATVAMFSVLHDVVLRPLPYDRPTDLAVLSTHAIAQNQFDGTSGANFHDWRRESRSFAGMTMYRRTSASRVIVDAADGPERVQEGLVGPEFFDLLGTAPIAGRTFSREEFDRGDRLAVVSEGLWAERFGRAGDVVGQPISIAGERYTVIGVMPTSFQLPTADTRLWRPLSVLGSWWQGAQTMRDGDSFEVLGRLAPGVRLADASAEMAVIAARLRDAYPEDRNLDVRVTSLFDHVVGARTSRGLWLGLAAVAALLGVACANAGGLLVARAARRRRELAVRAALGAGRGRLVQQLLAEHVSLWILASVLGLAIATALIRTVVTFGPAGLPRGDEIGLDVIAVLAAFAIGLVVVAICGSVPALVASKADATAAFRSREASGPAHPRVHAVLVTAQVAGAMTLVVVATLFATSFSRVRAEDPGYPADRVLVARIDRPARPGFFLEARDRLNALPGVVAVGGITDFFIRRAGDQRVTIEGRSFADADGRLPKLVLDSVTPGYFRAMDIAVVDGRDFDDRDLQPGAPSTVIVSDAMARRYWPGESAIGKRLVGGATLPADGRWATVIGVVKDLRREGLDVAPILSAFIPALLQRMDMTIRTATPPGALIPAIRRELRAIDPSLPMAAIVTAETRLDERLGPRRFELQALIVFAAIALLLAAAGLYASLAYQVALRTREIGIRTALGADRSAIVRLFIGRGVALSAIGIAIGLVTALATARLIQSLLYETPAVSVISYGIAAGVVLLVALVAAWRPARAAARVSPMPVLRDG